MTRKTSKTHDGKTLERRLYEAGFDLGYQHYLESMEVFPIPVEAGPIEAGFLSGDKEWEAAYVGWLDGAWRAEDYIATLSGRPAAW